MSFSKNAEAVKTEDIPFWHVTYKGVVLPAFMTKEALDSMKSHKIKASDIFISSYPKSGSTWMKQILISLLEINLSTTTEGGALLEQGGVTPKAPFFAMCPEQFLDTLPSPRLFKEHVMCDIMPTGFSTVAPRVIYLVRNPKDVVVSYMHHMTLFKIDQFEGDLEDMVRLFCEGKLQFGDWAEHVKSWCFGNVPNLLLVTYEDMVHDCETQVHRVARFLGLTVDSETIHRVVEECQFNNMRARDLAHIPGSPSFVKKDLLVDETKHFLREGKVGTWKRYLTVAQSERIDQVYNKVKEGFREHGVRIHYEP